jgi:DNA-directed RNA polymerase specialized sigma24 family protein
MMSTLTRSRGDAVTGPNAVLTDLYTAHYRGLVRLAAYLTGDPDGAEEVVQDAYVRVHGSWRGLVREPSW